MPEVFDISPSGAFAIARVDHCLRRSRDVSSDAAASGESKEAESLIRLFLRFHMLFFNLLF